LENALSLARQNLERGVVGPGDIDALVKGGYMSRAEALTYEKMWASGGWKPGPRGSMVPSDGAITKNSSKPKPTEPYSRPSGSTTQAQRDSVQGKPCVKCGTLTDKQRAGHKEALVKEYYESGTIDKAKMRSLDSVRSECPRCSAKEGAEMSRYSREIKRELGLGPR
jgi:hypothetical protein